MIAAGTVVAAVEEDIQGNRALLAVVVSSQIALVAVGIQRLGKPPAEVSDNQRGWSTVRREGRTALEAAQTKACYNHSLVHRLKLTPREDPNQRRHFAVEEETTAVLDNWHSFLSLCWSEACLATLGPNQ